VRAGDIRFDSGSSPRALRASLVAVPGIGDWTAQYVAMRALRDPDAFPSSDLGLLRALENGNGRPTPTQLKATAEAWRPWRAYAAMVLWNKNKLERVEP